MYKLNLVLSALMLLGLLMQPATARDVNSQEVSRLLKDGQAAIAQNRFDDALAKCRAGLEVLGDAYVRTGVLDDTGLKFIAADTLQRQGKVENASSIYCRTLAERFAQFNGK